jgi:hypothetical protein
MRAGPFRVGAPGSAGSVVVRVGSAGCPGGQRSHRRAGAAIDAGRFDEQIVPTEVKARTETVAVKLDEHVRRDVSAETLAKLRPAFSKDGTVTAGNASGVNAAAAAVVVMSADRAEKLGAPVRARILSYALCGVEPKTMGIGPVPAVRKALERAGKTLEEIDVIELNEAFAAQSLAVIKDLDLDPANVNPNGGAIALGASHRRHGRDHHDQDRLRDGTRGSQARTGQPLHRRRPGHRHGARARLTAGARGSAPGGPGCSGPRGNVHISWPPLTSHTAPVMNEE